jgi:signal transduction histidine kinase
MVTHLVSETILLQARVASEEIERARLRADSENQAKSAFLAHMAHELRTPLSGVIGLLDMLHVDQRNQEEASYLKMAKEASASLLIILNDILDLSAIEARELKLEEFSFNPRTVAEDVTRLLSFQAESKGVKLDMSFEPAIPEQLLGDPTRLRQILLNLIGNAIKFTEHGRVTVSFKGKNCPDSPNVFVLQGILKPNAYTLGATVEDTGIGMTPETMVGLFRPFSQGEGSIARRFGGTGLGLFICKQLCTLMGGDIDATSEVCKGSIFRFSVRLRLPEASIQRAPLIVTSDQRSKLPARRV